MASRSVRCELRNFTGEVVVRRSHFLAHGIWAPGDHDPALGEASPQWESESDGFMTGTEGRAVYVGPSGSVELFWNNPFVGGNTYGAKPSGSYIVRGPHGPATGSNVSVVYIIDMPKKPAPPKLAEIEPEATPSPAPEPVEEKSPDDHTRESHVPKISGSLSVLSPKNWLIDLAWQVVNNMEWNATILEITENRHGEQSGAACPGELPAMDGVGEKGTCRRPHKAMATKRKEREAGYQAELTKLKDEGMAASDAMVTARKAYPVLYNDFHSWCGDFVTWFFWKAWVLKGKREDKVTKAELGKFLNREAINGSWAAGENLNMVEKYSRGASGHLVFHKPGDDYVPKPGDIFMMDRPSGGHISIVASCDAEASYKDTDRNKERPFRNFITLDGKSFDMRDEQGAGWLEQQGVNIPAGAQGLAQTPRRTDRLEHPLRGFIDTSKLREALGYR